LEVSIAFRGAQTTFGLTLEFMEHKGRGKGA
jgi:hypothetical protein